MSRLLDVLRGRNRSEPVPFPLAVRRTADAQLEMGAALLYGLQTKNATLRFIEHCARVSALVHEMSELLSLPPDETADLLAAAQLHEIGMLAVPNRLVEEPVALDELSKTRIRQQAAIGAEIVGLTFPSRVALLIETQYADFATIRARFSEQSREALLAGVLRAADVVDAIQHPRPYQEGLDPAFAATVLRQGAGTKFHPLAVQSLLQLRDLN